MEKKSTKHIKNLAVPNATKKNLGQWPKWGAPDDFWPKTGGAGNPLGN